MDPNLPSRILQLQHTRLGPPEFEIANAEDVQEEFGLPGNAVQQGLYLPPTVAAHRRWQGFRVVGFAYFPNAPVVGGPPGPRIATKSDANTLRDYLIDRLKIKSIAIGWEPATFLRRI